MFKLIKYELRGNALTILGICITVLVGDLLLLTRRATWGTNPVSGLSTFLSIAAVTIIIISSFNLMNKYLHNDTGYLLFTLPQSGTNIILSRLLTALIQITLVIVVAILGICLTSMTHLDFSFLNYIKISGITFAIAIYIWTIITLLTFIYFCMVIGKVALRNKRLGKIGSFIIFILLTIALTWISIKLKDIFPQTITFNGSSLFKNIDIYNNNINLISHINISKLIFDALTFVAFFKGTTYMIDNKLDL